MGDSLSLETLPAAERDLWLATRHVPSQVDSLFADPQRSVVAMTYGGCGLTTSLQLLKHSPLLTFDYNPEHWPGGAHALTDEPGHFGLWMSHVADRFTSELRRKPELLQSYNELQLEFLVWIARRYLGRRQNVIWRQFVSSTLPADAWEVLNTKIQRGELDELYGSSTLDIQGQIDECLDLAATLGWEGIYACVEINHGDWVLQPLQVRDRLREGLVSLLGTLTPLQRTGFGLKAGVPHSILDEETVQKLVRGRAVTTSYQWPEEVLLELAAGEPGLEDEAGRRRLHWVWQALKEDVASIWGVPGPAAARFVAQLVLACKPDDNLAAKLTELRVALYRRAAPLRLDGDTNERQVWRGMQPIKLDETPFSFLERLWQRRGGFVGREELLQLAGSSDSLDQNISRVRKVIEPLAASRHWIYLHRNQTDGAWLDKNVCAFT